MRPTFFDVCCGVGLFLVVLTAHAQDKFSFKCTFGPGSAANWDSGKVSIERGNFGTPNTTIHFDAIDLKAGTARIIGNTGSTDLAVLNTGAGVTFIEKTGAGNFVLPPYSRAS